MSSSTRDEALGINSLGRIGKLLLWHHVDRGHFRRVVVNLGREVGRDLEAVCDIIERDSTYGAMHRFLRGVNATPCIRIVDRERRILDVGGVQVTVLQAARNPKDIAWREHGVRLVVDATGAFDDPTRAAEHPSGSLRGHLAAGADKVIYSAAFKIKDPSVTVPDDVTTLVYGINHDSFDPQCHHLVSAASCTTTALAHMLRPLVDRLSASQVMTASMSTVHAVTNSQSVLDATPAAGAKDLRRTRSALNSIILTSTNAAATLEKVIPELASVGFMADSVRVPVPTESLLILNITFQSTMDAAGESTVNGDLLNAIYRQAAEGPQRGLLVYSDRQNVPADVSGMRAAVVIEGVETHTRTGFVCVDLAGARGLPEGVREQLAGQVVEVPVTHAKIFGWYDNEYGSYTNLLGDLSVHVHQSLG